MVHEIEYIYKFSKKEINGMLQEEHDCNKQIIDLEAEKKATVSEFNEDINELKDTQAGLNEKVEDGFEELKAQANRIVNHDGGRAEFYDISDLENKKLLKTEPLTDQDMQGDAFEKKEA